MLYIYKGKPKLVSENKNKVFVSKNEVFRMSNKDGETGLFTKINDCTASIHMKCKYFKKEKVKRSIFISCSCNDDTIFYAKDLEKRLYKEKYGCLRKKRYIIFSFANICFRNSNEGHNLGNNLHHYMNSIPYFDFVTGIISYKYMLSLPCLYELTLAVKNYTQKTDIPCEFYVINPKAELGKPQSTPLYPNKKAILQPAEVYYRYWTAVIKNDRGYKLSYHQIQRDEVLKYLENTCTYISNHAPLADLEKDSLNKFATIIKHINTYTSAEEVENASSSVSKKSP